MQHRSISLLTPILMLATAVAIAACTTVPETGRRQLNFLDPRDEAALGLTEFEKIKKSQPISDNATYNAQVHRVGERLSRVMPIPNAEWEFVVFEDSEPNAFALPGGKVGVNTGLFQIAETDSGLAAVIGHEVAHVVARHSGERLSQGFATSAVAAAAGILINENTDMTTTGQVATATALGGAALLKNRNFSRKQELEADRMGAVYMARAGYNPREAVGLWTRFAAYREQKGGTKMPAWLSTHPVDSLRIAELEKFMPTAMQLYQP